MKLSNFIEGLLILKQYYEGQDGYHIGAEHDQFYAFATSIPLEPATVHRMKSLGWFQPEMNGPDSPYDPAVGWSAFT